MKTLQERSKLLSFILRHRPSAARVTLDENGWCSVNDLIANTDFTLDELRTIVNTDAKKRYSFKGDSGNLFIRANQGHSISVDLQLKKAVPPPVLYHGTNSFAADQIRKSGLKRMNRHHVHLTDNLETAKTVGGRRYNEAHVKIFLIDTKKMMQDGIEFYISYNGVWLVDAVPLKYLTELKDVNELGKIVSKSDY